MKNLNMAIIEGRLVREPKSSQSKKGNTVLKFSLASNGFGTPSHYNGKNESVSYFDVICWGDLAESMESKLMKGLKVTIYGHLSQWRWKNDQGHSSSKISIIANHIEVSKQLKKDKEIPF